MEMILFLQYILSLLVLAAVIFGLAMLKKRLLLFSVRLSENALRQRELKIENEGAYAAHELKASSAS